MQVIEKPELCGFSPVSCSYSEAAGMIISALETGKKHIFIHLNYYNYYILRNKCPLVSNCKENSTMFFEGVGMKSVAYLKRWGNLTDVNGTDLFRFIAGLQPETKLSVYLLGARKAIIAKATGQLRSRYKSILVKGYYEGYFPLDDEDELVDKINNSGARFLLIGMGMAKESEFLNRNFSRLKVDAIWAVGGLFDFLSGHKLRAPLIVRKMRLEWLFRLIIEPSKKFHRIFIVFFWFLYSVLFKRN